VYHIYVTCQGENLKNRDLGIGKALEYLDKFKRKKPL
jgi:hypothetical protein